MKTTVIVIIQIIALCMFIGGIIACFYTSNEAHYASLSYYNRSDEAYWDAMFYLSLATVLNSFLVLGFSYIVEAAAIYIERNKHAKEKEYEVVES